MGEDLKRMTTYLLNWGEISDLYIEMLYMKGKSFYSTARRRGHIGCPYRWPSISDLTLKSIAGRCGKVSRMCNGNRAMLGQSLANISTGCSTSFQE